jgi:hypothetical protein
MSIPDVGKSHNDAMDLIVDACQKEEIVAGIDGKLVRTHVLDPEIAWWKTHLVNSPTFARFAYELKEFERLGADAQYNMPASRAELISIQIKEIGRDFRYSIDAKSSETLRDQHNSQASLLDKLQKNRVEKAYTLSGEAKRSLWDGIMNRESQASDNE